MADLQNGYALKDMEGNSIAEWIGSGVGQVPGIPNPLVLPTGKVQVHCANVGVVYVDFDGAQYTLEMTYAAAVELQPTKTPEEKLAKFLTENPDVLDLIEQSSNDAMRGG